LAKASRQPDTSAPKSSSYIALPFVVVTATSASTPDAVRRTRAAGERVDRVGLNPDAGVNPRGFETAVYTEQSALFREGLALLPETATVQRAVLAEGAALADFMAERLPAVIAEWIVHRDALRAAGTLMDPSNPTRPE